MKKRATESRSRVEEVLLSCEVVLSCDEGVKRPSEGRRCEMEVGKWVDDGSGASMVRYFCKAM